MKEYNEGDILIVRSVKTHLPRSRFKVSAITDIQRPVEAYWDSPFGWQFSKMFPQEQIEFWLEKSEELQIKKR